MSDYSERDKKKNSKGNLQESVNDAAEEPNFVSSRAIALVHLETVSFPSMNYRNAQTESHQNCRERNFFLTRSFRNGYAGTIFLCHFHRPPMPSYKSCFKSIFKIHSENGSIWNHLVGFIIFIYITSLMLLRPITVYTPFLKTG